MRDRGDLIEQLKWASTQTDCHESEEIVLRAVTELRFLALENQRKNNEYRKLLEEELLNFKEQSCETCLFFKNSRCMRNPPVFSTQYSLGQYPSVATTFWCGEWSPDVDVIQDEPTDDFPFPIDGE
jgi:hypothetical protein